MNVSGHGQISIGKHVVKLLVLICLTAVTLLGSGCAMFTIDTMKNRPLATDDKPLPTRATETLATTELPNGVFVGIAMSGGGSRASNFSAAVLLELQKLGILQHAAVISSVSGSSLTAAYYGLYGKDEKLWNEDSVRRHFRNNFELDWFGRWFIPWNIARYWTSNFSRSDIMEQVLDNELYDDSQFKEMPPGLPKILINATSFTSGRRFVFSDESFAKNLNSRLDSYPIANAVMASSAFPGVFHDVTLKDYRISPRKDTRHYEHLLDGGPSDNLGTSTIIDIIKKLYKAEKKPSGCFMFVIDAFNYQETPDHVQEADTRKFWDFLFDTNVAAASDALLVSRRINLMRELDIYVDDADIEPYVTADIYLDDQHKEKIDCQVWHLTFQRMYSPSFELAIGDKEQDQEKVRDVRKQVNSIPTRYKLVEVNGYASKSVQDYIFTAARILIHDDKACSKPVLTQVCDWFAAKNLPCAHLPFAPP